MFPMLAKPFLKEMSLPAVTKHLKVLETAGLITKSRNAQWRPCTLNAGRFQGRGRLDGAVSNVLGAEFRPPRRLFENRHFAKNLRKERHDGRAK